MIKRLIMLLLMASYCADICAQEEDQAAIDTMQPADPFFKAGGMAANVYAGWLDSASESQFAGIRAEYALGLGLSAALNNYPYLSLDVELFGAHREFDTPVSAPILGTVDNDTSLDTTALLFGVRAFYPAQGKLRAYASAGLGFFNSKMYVSGSVIGLPASLEQTDNALDIYWGAGASYLFGKWGLSLDYRHFDVDGSFSDFNISNADLGGDMLLIGLVFTF